MCSSNLQSFPRHVYLVSNPFPLLPCLSIKATAIIGTFTISPDLGLEKCIQQWSSFGLICGINGGGGMGEVCRWAVHQGQVLPGAVSFAALW